MYSQIKDQNIYYQKLGKGPDLIMLHGWKNDVSSFTDVAQVLKDDFTLWLIDLPGFGRSEEPKIAFSVSDYAEVVAEFIKEHKLSKPNLLGHSLGGRVSIKLASTNREIINKLILEDAAGIKPKQDSLKYLIYPIAKVLKMIIPKTFNLRERARRLLYKKLESDYLNAGGMKETLTNILKEDQTEELSKIKNETLIIWGENDELPETTVANARRMYKLIPNSKIEILEKAGHHPHLENPKMFLYFVKDFLK